MMPPDQTRLVHQWIEKAEEDFRNAEYTLTLQEDCPLSTVSFYAVEARYPGDWDVISRREAEEAFVAASTFRQQISGELLRMLGPCDDS
jgi:hypothetical protein